MGSHNISEIDRVFDEYNKQHKDDDLATYDPERAKEALQHRAKEVAQRFTQMCSEMHIPFLDVKLIERYFLRNPESDKLDKMDFINGCLAEHRAHTLRLLKLAFEREQLFYHIKILAYDFAQNKVGTLEAQTKVLQLLYRLQQVTLSIVEGVQEWRTRLTRPYAFEWKSINYMFKILKDCEFVDNCELNVILPLQLTIYPLCSEMNSLHLFATQPVQSNNGVTVAITYPMKTNKKTMIPQLTPEYIQRLKAAEQLLFAEHTLQVNLLTELCALCNEGMFITVLDIRSAVPNCFTGIMTNNKQYDTRLKKVLTKRLGMLQTRQSQHSEEAPTVHNISEKSDEVLSVGEDHPRASTSEHDDSHSQA